jgi:hypothetical protein
MAGTTSAFVVFLAWFLSDLFSFSGRLLAMELLVVTNGDGVVLVVVVVVVLVVLLGRGTEEEECGPLLLARRKRLLCGEKPEPSGRELQRNKARIDQHHRL